jgi:hypothetical protein
MIKIAEALRQFLAHESEGAPESAEQTGFLIENLVDFLEGYGYQYVDQDPHGLAFSRRDVHEDDELEPEFIEKNTPEMIPESLSEFLYYWNIRKFMGDEDDARETALLMVRLMDWLADEGLADKERSAEAASLAQSAVEELPKAKRLSDLLYDMAKASRSVATDDVEEEVDDLVRIERVERGYLWFDNGIGRIEVPGEVSQAAEVGWFVNVLAEKRSGSWTITEVGNVYPRMNDDEATDDETDDPDWDESFPETPSPN